jgi:hypothetical protein
MTNTCEHLIKIVTKSKPKMLLGLNQNGTRTGSGNLLILDIDVAPPVDRMSLNRDKSSIRNMVSPMCSLMGNPTARKGDSAEGMRMRKKRMSSSNRKDRH